mgnify:CR=1 FL=1
MDSRILFIALAAFGGGLLSALLGWAESGEPFAPRKFLKSVGFALFSAIGFAVAYEFTNGLALKDLGLAVLGGAGVDSLSNRATGWFGKREPGPSG